MRSYRNSFELNWRARSHINFIRPIKWDLNDEMAI